THIQSLAGLRRLTVPLPNITVFATYIIFIPQDFPLSRVLCPRHALRFGSTYILLGINITQKK
ncbi:MAG: hypothetical protein Q4B68_10490, partial [Bacteroidales bacterium]|nr:hypothetical protein [Bacteroidales bacterium]